MLLTSTNVSWKMRTWWEHFVAVNLQKGHLASSKFIYTSLYKKSLEARMSTKIHKLSKGEKVNKLGGNYSISTRLNLKTRCISEKKKNTIVSNSKNTIKKRRIQ